MRTGGFVRPLRDLLATTAGLFVCPFTFGDQLRKIRKVQRQLALSLGRAATVKEVAQELSMPVEKLRELQMQGRHPLSLDMKVGSEQKYGVRRTVRR